MAEMQSTTSLGHFGAIVLAGGSSTRMGSPKALLDIQGMPLICRLIRTARQVMQIRQILVVTGHEPQRIREAVCSISDQKVTFVHNPAHAKGEMISSVKEGIRAVGDDWDGFFLMLLDQPLIHHRTLEEMAQLWRAQRPALVIPTYHGQRGHPLLIASRCVASILSLPTDRTLREFVNQYKSETKLIEVDDHGVLCDIDTPHDYQRVLEQLRIPEPKNDRL